MYVFFVIFAAILGNIQAMTLQQHIIRQQWEAFKLEHNKQYESAEEDEYRMDVFMQNLDTISKHNQLYHMGLSTYTMGMNQFGDLTDDEFERYYLMPDSSNMEDDAENMDESHINLDDISRIPLPKSIDWRLLGAVTEVKDQGRCGACYAFSATGALEAQNYLATKELISLSEQNIIDCTYKTRQFKNRGCLGGRVDITFRYIIKNMGIDTEESYPYKAVRNMACRFNRTNVGAVMSSFRVIKSGNETQLQWAIARIGPVSVMVDAAGMKFYSGGLYDNPKCSSKRYSHGMLVVGYGRFGNLDYWLAKNSWGNKWGENGYIMTRRNHGNQCAIATRALFPII